jgi:hypothetical protein
MRLRLLPLALAASVCLAAPAAAQAKLTVGISENQSAMFTDPHFAGLGVEHARVVVSYDVMTSGDDELTRVADYLARARAAGVQPLVTFEHSRGDASICSKRRNHRKAVCKLPSQRAYRNSVRRFLTAFPWVKTISPWNEVNHFTQPTSRNPKAAAGFTNTVAKLCRSCTVVAIDLLDQADRTRGNRRPTYRHTTSYVKRFKRALKVPRKVCGLHNYSDVNRFRGHGTKALIKALGCRQVWLTETGGLYKFASFWTKKTRKGCRNAVACQVKATKYMFSLARRNKRVKRLYVYTYFGNVTPRFDAGLVDARTGEPRRAYAEVKKRT